MARISSTRFGRSSDDTQGETHDYLENRKTMLVDDSAADDLERYRRMGSGSSGRAADDDSAYSGSGRSSSGSGSGASPSLSRAGHGCAVGRQGGSASFNRRAGEGRSGRHEDGNSQRR